MTIAQYVLPSAPAFGIFVQVGLCPRRHGPRDDRQGHHLPAATGGLRYYDQGHVESATAVGDGYDIVLRRYTGSYVNDWGHRRPDHLPPDDEGPAPGYVIGNPAARCSSSPPTAPP